MKATITLKNIITKFPPYARHIKMYLYIYIITHFYIFKKLSNPILEFQKLSIAITPPSQSFSGNKEKLLELLSS